jgi:hypothetical protein
VVSLAQIALPLPNSRIFIARARLSWLGLQSRETSRRLGAIFYHPRTDLIA